ALAFDRAPAGEDLLGEVTWGVRQRCRGTRWQGLRRGTSPAAQGSSAFVTELGACRIWDAASRTLHGQGRCALVAKPRSLTILVVAARALHGSSGELFQQRLGLLQICRVESFGEPAVDLRQHSPRFVVLPLLL